MSPLNFPPLPIDALLPDILRTLEHTPSCVIQAPPGSGKTTRVPLAMLNAPWRAAQSKILVLEPRRLAARAAARHMAALLGEKVGQTVGYRTRLDIRVSAQTRVEVVTEGILTRMLHDDPELPSLAGVIFDEFHVRTVQADLGLALCLDVRQTLRPDLRLVLMSATIESEAVTVLAQCPVLTCPGSVHPVTTQWVRVPAPTVEERVAKAIRMALTQESGDILVFLPGAREIRRTAELVEDVSSQAQIYPLLGAMSPAQQDQAIAPCAPGQRKIVLATAIAETSLTIEGVRVVIDSGLARVPRLDAKTGMTALVTEPAPLATLEQRAGRAGRTQPGLCLRVWNPAEDHNRKAFPRPEILDNDLAALAVDLALWGVRDAHELTWITAPPASRMHRAKRLLRELGAVDDSGRITSHGLELARLPLHPRLGHMVLTAKTLSLGPTAARLAAFLAEPNRGLRGSSDLRTLCSAPGARRQMSQHASTDVVIASAEQIARMAQIAPGPLDPQATGRLVSLAYPDRIARRQDDGSYRLTSGRKAVWPVPNALGCHEFLAIADLDAQAKQASIWLAAPLEREDLDELHSHALTEITDLRYDGQLDRVVCSHKTMLHALCVEERPGQADPATMSALFLDNITDIRRLPWSPASVSLRQRAAFMHEINPEAWPDVSDAALLRGLQDWLGPFTHGAHAGAALRDVPLLDALRSLLGWERLPELDRLAPEYCTVPSGASRRIDYSSPAAPVLPVKLQEMFGCTDTPTLAGGRVTLVLHLLSPAGRPLHITRDLASFWSNAYPHVRAEMRGRYPKHPWPENPRTALPTAKTKKHLV